MIRRLAAALLLLGACTSDSVDSNEQARRAYLGLDSSIGKSLNLGFAGFNAASSANIPSEIDVGDSSGTLTIAGQVDQGSSANKQMRLTFTLDAYSDGPFEVDSNHDTYTITYASDTTTVPALGLSLKGIPTGTITGSLVGTFHLTGDIVGDVALNLMIAGTMADGGGGTVTRVPGTTTITGTATQGDGVYNVDATL